MLAQRLVRRLCPSCRESRPSDDADRQLFGPHTPASIYTAGCPACGQTGYAGRTGIYELITVDDAFGRLIHNAGRRKRTARTRARPGARSLRDDGLRLLAAGTTSAEELLRVTRD